MGASAVAGAVGNLVPWKPGQSGNPAGHSKARRQAKRLRQALDVMLEQEIPPGMLDGMPDEITESLPPDVTFAELIALRITWVAAISKTPSEILAAANMILSAQAKPDAFVEPPKTEPPRLPSTEERRQSVAEQLGVDLSAETPGDAD